MKSVEQMTNAECAPRPPRNIRRWALAGVLALVAAVAGGLWSFSAHRAAEAPRFEEARAREKQGEQLAAEGKGDEAIVCYRQAIRFDPARPDAYIRLGVLLKQAGRPGQAVKMLRKAIAADPNRARDILRRAPRELLEKGRIEEAISMYYRALILDPEDLVARMELAQLLASQGMLRDATYHYRVVLGYDPSHRDAWFNLGVLADAQGSRDGALASYRKVLELDPNDQAARERLQQTVAKEQKAQPPNP